jgi:DNA-binding protein H-NS
MQIDDLTLSELKTLRNKIEALIQKRLKQNIKIARMEAEKAAKKYGLTLKEIVNDSKSSSSRPKKAKRVVEPKYRNPENSAETWTGRGKKPKWVEGVMERGLSLQDIKIKD